MRLGKNAVDGAVIRKGNEELAWGANPDGNEIHAFFLRTTVKELRKKLGLSGKHQT